MKMTSKWEKNIVINDSIPYIESYVNSHMNNPEKHISCMCLTGPPGIGKSELIETLCENNKWGLDIYYLSTSQLEALSGLPKTGTAAMTCFFEWFSDSLKLLKKNKNLPDEIQTIVDTVPLYNPKKDPSHTIWSRPDIISLKNVKFPKKNFNINTDPVILFLDDIHLVNKTMQSYLFQLLTYRGINSHFLPQNIILLMAGNRSCDLAGFQQMLAPITNRIYFLEVCAEVDDWIEHYAVKNNIRLDIIMFLKHNENCFMTPPTENVSWSSPRSWTYASEQLNSFINTIGEDNITTDNLFNIVKGHVDNDSAIEFIKYKVFMSNYNGSDILEEKITYDYDKLNHTEVFAIISVCVSEIISRMRYNQKHKPNKSLCNKNFEKILNLIYKNNKHLVALALGILVKNEVKLNNKITFTRKLVSNTNNNFKEIGSLLL